MDKDYSIEFNLTEGGLAASVKIVPSGTEVNTLNVDDLLKAIKDEGITVGLLTEPIGQIVLNKTVNKWVEIARGQAPEEGKDGYVKFHFDTGRTKATFKEDASGKVILRDLHRIQNVKKGVPLCELIPLGQGNPA